MPLPKIPKEHNDLLLRLKRSIDEEALEEMKLVVRADDFGGFQDAELEKVKNVIQMLRELEVKGVIRVGGYEKLKEIMRSIDKISLIEDINATEELLYEKGYRVASKVSNAEIESSHRVSEHHQSQMSCSGDTAAVMENDAPLQAANEVEEILRTRYRTTGSFVQTIPWVGGDMKPISDIYTKLKLKNTNNRGQQLKSYEDIFLEKTKEGDPIQRIILKGIAGVGKSTLIDKMAYDWAKGEKLKEYKLVFILKMFALEESSELSDAVFNQLVDLDSSISKDDLRSYITTNPAKVLILFDGFDEFKTTDVFEASQLPGDVCQIFNRKILRGSCVVVTTRPSHFHNLVSKPLIEKPFVHVEVLGFNEEDIKKYICRFFSEKHDRAEGLFQKIKSSNVLSDLAKSPMLLLLMCILWGEQSTIPDTMYRLYTDALRFIFERKELPPDETRKVVISIGENALDDLLSPHQFLSFKEGDFKEQALQSALKAGVLTSQRVIRGLDTRHSVSFIHRTFQEYCAAIFFQSLLETDEEQFYKNLDRVGNIMKDGLQGLEYLLRFCCGDNQSCTNKVLNLMHKCFGQTGMIKNELSVKCYFEGQFKDLPSVDLIPKVMVIENYSNDGLRALFYYLTHVSADDKKNRGNAQLGKVTALRILRGNLESFGEVLGEAMSGMTNLSIFELRDCSVTPASMKYIASSFVSTPKLKKIEISLDMLDTNRVQGIGGSLPSWGHNLQSLKQLESLTLMKCELQHIDQKYIAALLGSMENLVHCKVNGPHNSGPFDIIYVIEYVYGIRRVQIREICLFLADCSLTCSELSDILSGFKTREGCHIVQLQSNHKLGGLANIWAQHLKYLKGLQKLFLNSCALQSKDIEPLARSLSAMSTTFCELYLWDNPSLGGNAASWAHLGQLTQLKRLVLSRCSLTGLDIEALAKSVGSVQTLILDENSELRHSVASWAPFLRHFEHLKKLNLQYCGFTNEDKTLIKEVLPNRVYIQMNG